MRFPLELAEISKAVSAYSTHLCWSDILKRSMYPVRVAVNAFAERFVRSIKDGCLGRMLLVGASSLRRAFREYAAHYHAERNHQGVGNRLLEPLATVSSINDPIKCRERLGGMLNFY